MGKKRGLSVAERAKIVTLNEEGYSERQISKKLKFSKTAIHSAIVKFQNFGSFQDLHSSGRPSDKENGSTFTYHFKQEN